VAQVSSPLLAAAFGQASTGGGRCWSRLYVFYHGGAPLSVILEFFSPRLEAYLGPAAPA
jgi:chorismate-pyruvate lyase